MAPLTEAEPAEVQVSEVTAHISGHARVRVLPEPTPGHVVIRFGGRVSLFVSEKCARRLLDALQETLGEAR